MLQYVCEWCRRVKNSDDRWILGFAAEKVGAISAHRELTIAAEWSERWAAHPLAVHFCSEKHKEQYVLALFDAAPAPRRQKRTRTAPSVREGTSVSVSAGALVEPAEVEHARTSAEGRSRRRQRPSRRPAVFSAPDGLRAHGLSVRLEDSTPVVHPPHDDSDLYGGA